MWEHVMANPELPARGNLGDTLEFGASFAKGTVLNDTYELRDVLGSGGMGQVWDAFDRKLGRPVAIKISWPHAPPGLLNTEGKAMAQLRHPGVPAVHAMGTHLAVDYIVMERLVGRSLQDHLAARAGHQFTLDEILDVLIGVADALRAIHRSGYVHRDVKPDNIMLAPQGRVVLLDLGLMQRVELAASNEQVFGSPHYVAPEVATLSVAAGTAHQLDVYSLGALAHQLMTGRPPFEAESVTELVMMHVRAAVPSAYEARPDVPIELHRLVESMLGKKPSDRPYSVDIVGTSLRAVRRGRHQHSQAAPLSVIIADDDAHMRLLLEACVENVAPNAEIRVASDGAIALDQFLSEPPHLMLVDLRMPGMNGMELCMHVRGTNLADETTIVAVSAHATGQDRELLEQLGVVDFVSKKVDSEALIAQLVDLVRGIQQTRRHIYDTAAHDGE